MMGLMTIKDLIKPHRTTGELRADVLLRMIANGEQFETIYGKTALSLGGGDYINIEAGDYSCFQYSNRRYAPILIPLDESVKSKASKLCLSDLYKTETLIGKRNRLTNQTELQECGQLLHLATAFNGEQPMLLCDMKCNVKQVTEFITERSWVNSFTNSTHAILPLLDPEKQYTFHRKSTLIQQLYNQARVFIKGKLSSVDRWNPSDVWIVSSEITTIPTFADIWEMNAWIREKQDSRDLMGLSLKKTPNSATVTVHNRYATKLEVRDIHVGLSRTDDIFSSKETHMRATINGEAVLFRIRSHETYGNVQVEVQGKHAMFGKVGLGVVDSIFVAHMLPMVSRYRNAQDAKWYCNQIGQLYSFPESHTKTEYLSKAQGVNMVHTINMAADEVKQRVIAIMYQHVTSQTEYSSAFWKVS